MVWSLRLILLVVFADAANVIHGGIFLLPQEFRILVPFLIASWGLCHILSLIKTEYIVTNKRVMSETGIIAAKTKEVRNPKIESFNIDQNILGRLLEYASLEFTGTGTQRVKFHAIADPIGTKRHFETIVENSNRQEL